VVIRAVTIDAHGVLLLPDPEAIRVTLAEFSCEPDDQVCWTAHYQMVRLLDQLPHPDWPTMNRSFAQALGVRPSLKDEAGQKLANTVYLGTSWIPAPGAASALARIVDQGFGAAVVSNTVHGELAELLRTTKLCSVGGNLIAVAAIIDSHVTGIEKPDPRPFLSALEALGVDASECVHVGDSLHSDVAGAINVGMRPVHIDPLTLCDDLTHEHSSSLEEFVNQLM
jgi:putative hydrolase of the HAD superfamily